MDKYSLYNNILHEANLTRNFEQFEFYYSIVEKIKESLSDFTNENVMHILDSKSRELEQDYLKVYDVNNKRSGASIRVKFEWLEKIMPNNISADDLYDITIDYKESNPDTNLISVRHHIQSKYKGLYKTRQMMDVTYDLWK